ncbi:CBS domain-containing protein [Streptomyces sp. NPDC057654]|uniref:CBS domain-containing protein n=1 Tax=Streptomyces sp. NPDC057654 TaxID=3346196 RepID=UPI003680FF58
MSDSPHTVSDVMTHTVVAMGREATFKEIVRTLEQWKVSAVPILEGEGRVIGVVSEADLLPKEEFRESRLDLSLSMSRLGAAGDRLSRLRLAGMAKAGAMTAVELMSTPAVTIHADATLAQAARTMAQQGLKRLPVIDSQGFLAGIVSRGDLLKVFLRPDEEIAHEVRETVVEALFPAAVEPVVVSVDEGVVSLAGRIADTSLVPVAARLARAVEGVVGVEIGLTGAGAAASPAR